MLIYLFHQLLHKMARETTSRTKGKLPKLLKASHPNCMNTWYVPVIEIGLLVKLHTNSPPIYLYFIFEIFYFEMSSLMNLFFVPSLNWIITACVVCNNRVQTWKKNLHISNQRISKIKCRQSNFQHQLSWMLSMKKLSKTTTIFFLFITETFKLQQTETFVYKLKKRLVVPDIFSYLASQIIDVRNQAKDSTHD